MVTGTATETRGENKLYCNFFKGPFDGAAVNETAETTFIGEIEAEYDAFKEKLGEWKAGLINQVKGFSGFSA